MQARTCSGSKARPSPSCSCLPAAMQVPPRLQCTLLERCRPCKMWFSSAAAGPISSIPPASPRRRARRSLLPRQMSAQSMHLRGPALAGPSRLAPEARATTRTPQPAWGLTRRASAGRRLRANQAPPAGRWRLLGLLQHLPRQLAVLELWLGLEGGAGAGAGGIAASPAAHKAAGPAANGGATAGQLVAADSPGSGSEEEQNPMQPVQGELFRHTCPGQHSHPVLHSG